MRGINSTFLALLLLWTTHAEVLEWRKSPFQATPVHMTARLHKIGGSFRVINQQPSTVAEKLLGEPLVAGAFSPAEHHVSQFSQLHIAIQPSKEEAKTVMKAAGFMEGYLSAWLIADFATNLQLSVYDSGFNDTAIAAVESWLLRQDAWVKKQMKVSEATLASDSSSSAPSQNNIWKAIGLLTAQVDGIMEGYDARREEDEGLPALTRGQFLFIQAWGDTMDLLPMLSDKKALDLTLSTTQSEAWHALSASGHCSALIKVTGDLADILFGHVTWVSYRSMTRVYKHYNFSSLNAPLMHNTLFSFSSYPGAVTSIDDFMMMKPESSRMPLVVMETSNTILNTDLYKPVVPSTLLSYQRVSVANYLSSSGAEWVSMVVKYNSGTYANQYMALDLALFTPGRSLRKGLLNIVENIPGLSLAADVTDTLVRGYWPSYNVPYFSEIYQRSGYAWQSSELTKKWGTNSVALGLDYQLAPRAKLFRRDQGEAVDLQSFAKLMRSNQWQNDSYSGNAGVWGSVCPRGDLDLANPKLDGCTDAKISSFQLLNQVPMGAIAIAGPSRGSFPPFSFSGYEGAGDKSHQGMPDLWLTQFELQAP